MVRIIKKTFNTTVSVKEGASRSVLRGIIQYDTLNEVNIRLSDGSKAFNYDGYTNIVFKVLKADGTSYIDSEGENVIATSPVDGIITVNLTGQAAAAAGLCQSVIEIYSGEDKMTTARFNYEVFETLDTAEATDSESQYPVFQNLMADLSELEASIEAAEAQRVTAELARASSASGYVAQAEAAKTAAKASAATAEEWAKQAKAVAGGNFAPAGLSANMAVYVSPNGNDETGDGTASMPYATIQKAINSVPKSLSMYTATIRLFGGTYTEDVDVRGFSGGAFQLLAAETTDRPTINGAVNIAGNSTSIYMGNVDVVGRLYAQNCAGVVLFYCTVRSDKASAIFANTVASANISMCTVSATEAGYYEGAITSQNSVCVVSGTKIEEGTVLGLCANYGVLFCAPSVTNNATTATSAYYGKVYT